MKSGSLNASYLQHLIAVYCLQYLFILLQLISAWAFFFFLKALKLMTELIAVLSLPSFIQGFLINNLNIRPHNYGVRRWTQLSVAVTHLKQSPYRKRQYLSAIPNDTFAQEKCSGGQLASFFLFCFFDEPKLHRRYLQSSCTIFKGLAISVDYPPLGFATANIEQVYDRQRKSESGRGQEIEDAQIWPHQQHTCTKNKRKTRVLRCPHEVLGRCFSMDANGSDAEIENLPAPHQ